MTEPMPFSEWFFRFLALKIERYRPPAPPSHPGTLTQLDTEPQMHLTWSPPALPTGAVSFELHYVPSGGTETILPTGPDPVAFEVLTAGPLTFFCVGVSTTGVKGDPGPTDTFTVSDTWKPGTPTSAGTMAQVD